MIKKIDKRLKASEVLYNVDISDYTDAEYEYEYVIDELKDYLDYCISEINTDNYIVFGALGLWSGSVEGRAFKRIDSYDDIFWCVGRSEELTNVTVFNNGNVEISTSHHDGYNTYTFKPLCNMTVKELRVILAEIANPEYLRDHGFTYLRTKDRLLDALNEYVD